MKNNRRSAEASGLRQLFQQQWDHILELIEQNRSEKEEARRQRKAELSAVETVVDGTNSRMRIVSSYREKLRYSTRILLNHVDSLVENLPDPIIISQDRFSQDPQLNASFVNKESIADIFSRSHELQEFLATVYNSHLDQVYALLFMTRNEKSIQGIDMTGEVLTHGVQQTTISFSNHQVCSPCATEDEIKKALKKYLFDSIVSHVQYFMAHSTQRINGENHAIPLNNPEIYLQELVNILGSPDKLLRINKDVIRVNRMGIKIPGHSKTRANEISLHEIQLAGWVNRVVIMVRYPRTEILPVEAIRKQAIASFLSSTVY